MLAEAQRLLERGCIVNLRFAEIHYPAQPQDLWCTFSAGLVELCDDSDSLMMAAQADEA